MAQAGFRLLSARSLRNEAASGNLPTRIKVLDWGENETLKGKFTVNETTLSVLKLNQQKMGRDTVALDYEHNTVPGATEYERTKEPRDVAAHFKVEVVRGDGVYLTSGEWTPSGKDSAKNYPDLSPTLYSNDAGEVIGIHSVALTRTGAKVDLHFKTLSLTQDDPYARDLVSLSCGPMDANPYTVMNAAHMKVLKTLMGMDGKSDEETLSAVADEVTKGVITRKGPLDTKGGITPTRGVECGEKAMPISMDQLKVALEAFTKPLADKVTALTAAADAATQATEKAARDALVARATREGKVIPLSEGMIATLSVEALTALVNGLPKTIDLQRKQPAIVPRGTTGTAKAGKTPLVTLNADGTYAIATDSGAGGSPRGLNRTAEIFAEQMRSAETVKPLN